MSMFGYGGFGSNDPNVQSKLAALKAKKHNDPNSQVKEFLERDLGVDPRELPFNLDQAREFLGNLLRDQGAGTCRIEGNSMGIKHIALTVDASGTQITCPQCGTTNGWWSNYPTEWFCDECEGNDQPAEITVLPHMLPKGSNLTEDAPNGADWHDVKRTFDALVKGCKFQKDTDSDPTTVYSWDVTGSSWRGPAEVTPVEPKHVKPDPKSYPTGTVLLVEKHILGESGQAESHHEYVRVGGLFNDDDIVILSTMQPITDLTGWTVTEVLQ